VCCFSGNIPVFAGCKDFGSRLYSRSTPELATGSENLQARLGSALLLVAALPLRELTVVASRAPFPFSPFLSCSISPIRLGPSHALDKFSLGISNFAFVATSFGKQCQKARFVPLVR
jgi:hypothetical protein